MSTASQISLSQDSLFACCSANAFAAKLFAAGPFTDMNSLLGRARTCWWRELTLMDWLEAFDAHPKIGESSHSKPAAFAAYSSTEQAAADGSSSADVQSDLRQFNAKYLARFGHIFIICASGRSAPEILSVLKRRCENMPHEELATAASEQMAITELRLCKLWAEASSSAPASNTASSGAAVAMQATAQLPSPSPGARSPITTHVLDTATGLPAQGLPLALLKQDTVSLLFQRVSGGVTNEDGRVGSLLPPSDFMAPGRYRMHFDVAAYHKVCKLKHASFYADTPFYNEVVVEFNITADKSGEHYHIPLLLSPFGYSTYRGS